MRIFLSCILFLLFINVYAQTKRYNDALLDTLEAISNTNTPSRYFAKLYYNSIEATNKQISKVPDSIKQFVVGFGSLFGPAFFKAHKKFVARKSQEYPWQCYYADTLLNEMQYGFMGMNAHINGDMWLALKDKYCYDTLKKYKRPLIKFQRTLNGVFDSVFSVTRQYKKLRRLHVFTLGLDKVLGKKMILNWRKRQIKMAMLWYSNPAKCKRKLVRIQKRKLRLDRFAVKMIR